MTSQPHFDTGTFRPRRPIFIVKLGGAAADACPPGHPLWSALGRLHRSLGAGGGVVLVHGGGNLVDARLSRLGLRSVKVDGLRVTPEAHMDEVVAALAGISNTQIVGALLAAGTAAVGLTLADGFLARAEVRRHPTADLGRVGAITGGDASLVHGLLDAGMMPVIAPIACDGSGGLLNVNADDAAAALAAIVGAVRLVLLSDVPGVMLADGTLMAELDEAGMEALVASGVISGGMVAKVRAAMEAAAAAGCEVLIAGWKDPTVVADLAGFSSTDQARAAHGSRARAGTLIVRSLQGARA